MATQLTSLAPERLALLGRAAVESCRYAAEERESLSSTLKDVTARIADAERSATTKEVEALLAPRRPEAGGSPAPAAAGGSAAGEVLRQKAGLELQLASVADKLRTAESAYAREQAEHRQAVESLSLQQRKLKELQEERGRLLENVSELESQLRLQIAETEQAQLRYEKLKSSRQTMSAQSTEMTEKLNALQADNERLRAELEAARKQRDVQVSEAQAEVQAAQADTADAVIAALWSRMRGELPNVFTETHIPTRESLERLCEAIVEFVKAMAVIEAHVVQCLKDLRQVGDENDKLNRFYILFKRNPGLMDCLRDYVATGRGKANFYNLVRAHQVWARAFATGLYKVIVRLPNVVADELNPRNWGGEVRLDKEASIGKYFKETAQRAVPEKIGTLARKQAGDLVHQDYNDLIRVR